MGGPYWWVISFLISSNRFGGNPPKVKQTRANSRETLRTLHSRKIISVRRSYTVLKFEPNEFPAAIVKINVSLVWAFAEAECGGWEICTYLQIHKRHRVHVVIAAGFDFAKHVHLALQRADPGACLGRRNDAVGRTRVPVAALNINHPRRELVFLDFVPQPAIAPVAPGPDLAVRVHRDDVVLPAREL